ALPLDLRQQRRGRARADPLPALVPRRRGRRDLPPDVGDAPLRDGRRRERPEPRRERRDRGRPRSLLPAPPERERPHPDRLLRRAAAGLPLPRRLVLPPALGGRVRRHPPRRGRRGRVLRPRRGLRLRRGYRLPRGEAPPAPALPVNRRAFEEHVRRALDGLPPEVAEALENVAVVVEEADPDDPELFGLWQSHE